MFIVSNYSAGRIVSWPPRENVEVRIPWLVAYDTRTPFTDARFHTGDRSNEP